MKKFTLIDSHCHLQSINLTDFDNNLTNVLNQAYDNGVGHFLSVCVELEDLPALYQLAERYPDVSISVGIHPTVEMEKELVAADLVELASHPSCIAIGETGLDYYRAEDPAMQDIQRQRFREHILASRQSKRPLIIHTRLAAEDTLLVMKEEKADEIGGVMHCFSEDWSVAERAMDLNFYISFSGIVTFKSATQLQDIATKVPLDRMLIETDSPYLAPMPFRGKQNHPALVKQVALKICELRQMDFEELAAITTENFYRCFRLKQT